MHAFLTMSMSRINPANEADIDNFTFGPPSVRPDGPVATESPAASEAASVGRYSDPEPSIEADAPALVVTAAEFDIARHDAVVTLISPRTGEHRTFRVRTIRDGELAGARVVELLSGPSNTDDYTPFAFVSDGRHGKSCLAGTVCVWKRYRAERNEPASIWERYADMLNRPSHWESRGVEFKLALNCRRCGRLLTHRDSLADGMGPICRQKAMEG